jgi:hypothetical protein
MIVAVIRGVHSILDASPTRSGAPWKSIQGVQENFVPPRVLRTRDGNILTPGQHPPMIIQKGFSKVRRGILSSTKYSQSCLEAPWMSTSGVEEYFVILRVLKLLFKAKLPRSSMRLGCPKRLSKSTSVVRNMLQRILESKNLRRSTQRHPRRTTIAFIFAHADACRIFSKHLFRIRNFYEYSRGLLRAQA